MIPVEDMFPDFVKIDPTGLSDWVPASVREYVMRHEIDERALPLLRDERMLTVWQELSQRALADPKVLNALRLPNAKHYTPGEKACVAFFHQVQSVVGSNTPTARAELEEEVRPWREAVELLRKELKTNIYFDEADLDAEHVTRTIDYLEWQIRRKVQEHEPFMVERRRGKDDAVRVCGCRVIAMMRKTFGSAFYQTSATVTSVLMGADVTKKKIEFWAKGPQ